MLRHRCVKNTNSSSPAYCFNETTAILRPVLGVGVDWLARVVTHPQPLVHRLLASIAFWVFALMVAAVFNSSASADDSFQVRVIWGGGQSRSWKGTIRIRDGEFGNAQNLSVGLDAPGTVILNRGSVRVNHWEATDFGGANLEIRGGDQTKLIVELTNFEDPKADVQVSISMDELEADSIVKPIDDFGNVIFVERPSFDHIAISLDRPHLVFEPGDPLTFRWNPNRSSMKNQTTRGSLLIRSKATRDPVIQKTMTFNTDVNGSAQPIPMELEVPNREGVYQLELAVEPEGLQSTLGSNRRARATRLVEFVVLERAEAVDRSAQPESERLDIMRDDDAMGSDAWELLQRIDVSEGLEDSTSFWNRFPSRVKALGNDFRTVDAIGGRPVLRLLAGGWHAEPMQFPELNRPYLIEVDYVIDTPIALGLSLIEQENDQVANEGSDSGVYLDSSIVGHPKAGKIDTHQFVVWPRVSNSFLMLTNRHIRESVQVAEVRVLAEKPSERTRPISSQTKRNLKAADTRKNWKWISSPDFCRNLGVTGEWDQGAGEHLDDWSMFYVATKRLIEQLKREGFDGVYLAVAADGSSLYPSDLLLPSPRFDNGIFFRDGRDPVRKDVLELMLRMFEREGLSIVPVFVFNSPLPAIESQRSEDAARDTGFDLIGLNQQLHRMKLAKELPIYNPLSRTVQYSIGKVIEEFVVRYRDREAMEGVAILCRPDTATVLPGTQWGYDAFSIERFSQAHREFKPSPIWSDVQEALMLDSREAWIQWRANEMSKWYRALSQTVRGMGVRGSEKSIPLYLIPIELFHNQEMASAIAPSLHRSYSYEKQMLQMGFDPAVFVGRAGSNESDANPILLNAHRFAPDASPAAERVSYTVEHSNQTESFFASLEYAGDFFHHRNSLAEFEQLIKHSPFSHQELPIVRLQPTRPGGFESRKRFVEAIASRDSRCFVDGGDRISTASSRESRELLAAFRRLPDLKFDNVRSPRYSEGMRLPIAIRQLKTDSGTYFYLANASPWPMQVKLMAHRSAGQTKTEVQSLTGKSIEFATSNHPSKPQKDSDGAGRNDSSFVDLEAIINLEPYELVAGIAKDRDWEISDFEFRLPVEADSGLRRKAFETQAKLVVAKNAPPLSVLENARFDPESQTRRFGWKIGPQNQAQFQIKTSEQGGDSAIANGSRYLELRNISDRAVWVRSNAFSPPATGRLSVSVWLRTSDIEKQPAVRISLEGDMKTGSYYRFGSLGSLSANPINQIDGTWKRFAVHFDDLPVAEISELRIGFDLMGSGAVDLTEVAVYDHWFDEHDATAVIQMLAGTSELLLRPETFDRCRKLLENYWVVFLSEYVPNGIPEKPETLGRAVSKNRQDENQPMVPRLIGLEGDMNVDSQGRSTRREKKASPANNRVPMFRRLRDLGSRR